MKLPGRTRVAETEPEPQEKTRLCPQCGTPVSTRATTCAICGYDFVAAHKAKQRVQAEQREEAAQRPVRAIAIGVTAVIVLMLIAALVIRNRAEAVAALTPTATPTPTQTPTPSRTPTSTPTPPFSPTPIPPREYKVQPGDNIFYIADIFQVGYEDLLAFNGLTENSILQVGQTILIPPPTPTPTPSPMPQDVTPALSATTAEIVHIVQAGETLIGIAQQYLVPVDDILRANNIQDPNQIHAGDQIVIPRIGGPQSSPGPGTPTSLPNYGAVTLLQPLDGSRIVEADRPILLQWLSAGLLRDNETYRVTIEQIEGTLRPPSTYIRATSLHVLPDLFPPPNDSHRTFRWTVTIMRQVGVGNDGTPLYQVVSPSVARTFQWLPAQATPTLTPVPNP